MPNNYFQFKQFQVSQEKSAMKVCTDACLFGAWAASVCTFRPDRILDIGTGTGLLSLMIAQYFDVDIDAVEIDRDAAEEAASNFFESPWKSRLHLHHNDIRSFEPGLKYDFIISNPPFYESDLRTGNAAKDMARHDSSLTTTLLFENIKRLLNPEKGIAAILLPFNRKSDFLRAADENNLKPVNILDIRPGPDKPFFRATIMLSAKDGHPSCSENEMEIRNANDEYSDYFVSLLKDYYLKL